jgi:NAD(P)-dependent dehydrogenase (short-subunit alcohol dehydrogenase family)
MDLTNASATVTGGAGGFGSATVRRLAQKGAKVVIADVSDERGEAPAPTPSTCQLIAWTKTHVPAGATELTAKRPPGRRDRCSRGAATLGPARQG